MHLRAQATLVRDTTQRLATVSRQGWMERTTVVSAFVHRCVDILVCDCWKTVAVTQLAEVAVGYYACAFLGELMDEVAK